MRTFQYFNAQGFVCLQPSNRGWVIAGCAFAHTHTYTCTHTRSHTHIQFPAAALINDTYSDHDPKAHSHTSQGSHTHTTLTSQGSLTYIPRLTHTHVHTHQGSLTHFPRLTHTHTYTHTKAHSHNSQGSHTHTHTEPTWPQSLNHIRRSLCWNILCLKAGWYTHTHTHTHIHTHRAHVTSKLKSHTALCMLNHTVFKSWLVRTHAHTHRAHVTSKHESHTALCMLNHPVFKSWLVHTHAHTHTHTHTYTHTEPTWPQSLNHIRRPVCWIILCLQAGRQVSANRAHMTSKLTHTWQSESLIIKFKTKYKIKLYYAKQVHTC